MNYMVVERHPGYAVVLDDAGQFLKVADRQYEIGQMLTEVIPMQVSAKKRTGRWLTGLAAMAACIALVVGMFLPGVGQPYASVYVKINPEVRIDVDKRDVVVGLSGVNQDGAALIEGYNFRKKDLELVTDELVDRAIEMGYLVADGQIAISLDSKDQTWVEDHSHSISDHLQTHLQTRFTVTIRIEHHEKHHEPPASPSSTEDAMPEETRAEHHRDADAREYEENDRDDVGHDDVEYDDHDDRDDEDDHDRHHDGHHDD